MRTLADLLTLLQAAWSTVHDKLCDGEVTWPNSGAVKLTNYSTRYRPDLDLVLKDINLQIKAGEKVSSLPSVSFLS